MKKLDINKIVDEVSYSSLGYELAENDIRKGIQQAIKEVLSQIYDKLVDHSQDYGRKEQRIQEILKQLGIE